MCVCGGGRGGGGAQGHVHSSPVRYIAYAMTADVIHTRIKEVFTVYPTMRQSWHQLNYRAPLALILFNATLYMFVKISPRKAGIFFHLQRLQLRI